MTQVVEEEQVTALPAFDPNENVVAPAVVEKPPPETVTTVPPAAGPDDGLNAVITGMTDWFNDVDALGLKAANDAELPRNLATIEWVDTDPYVVGQVAVPPEPTVTAEQPAMSLDPSVNSTVPPPGFGATWAVKVSGWPAPTGLAEEVKEVDVLAGAGGENPPPPPLGGAAGR